MTKKMNNLSRIYSRITAIFLFFSSLIASAEEYKLSPRSIEQFKIFTDHVKDAREREKLAKAILTIAPFQALLEKPNPESALQIASTDWELLAKASMSIGIHFKRQLKTFSQLEAIKQKDSPADFRFWNNISKQF